MQTTTYYLVEGCYKDTCWRIHDPDQVEFYVKVGI